MNITDAPTPSLTTGNEEVEIGVHWGWGFLIFLLFIITVVVACTKVKSCKKIRNTWGRSGNVNGAFGSST